ncbi:MAG: flagellar protein FlgN [Tissierellaceae bacterium]|nr:flagellar protein FlgN [Tissierellaceae bacterium]
MTFKEELENVLKKELVVLRELKDLTFEKTDIIIGNKIRELEVMTKKEEELVNKMALLEEERETLMDNWGVMADTPISDIIEKVTGDREQLTNIKDEMYNIMEELQFRNKLNSDLIQENLSWIGFNINLIGDVHNQPSYGKDNKKANKSLFDRKV